MELDLGSSGILRSSDGAQYRRVMEFSADERGVGRRYKLLGSGGPEGGPGPDHVSCFLSFLVDLLCVDCTN